MYSLIARVKVFDDLYTHIHISILFFYESITVILDSVICYPKLLNRGVCVLNQSNKLTTCESFFIPHLRYSLLSDALVKAPSYWKSGKNIIVLVGV